ncbi:MAG: cysteine synthase CysM [Cytophagaceae bacterium]|jgi:cysteine synthase B|nr:cysteine synthase CysM [Cytophagaceae bacterium]
MASLVDFIGNTPLVEIKKILHKPNVRLFAKLEGHNPGGSVKDRAAHGMIKGALERGELKPGMKLIEATSGNTGIALAMIARLYDLEIELVMPENSTRERVLTMEAFGAKVILTPESIGIEGARDYAEAQVAKGGYVMLNQFANPDNYLAHYTTTGPEIWRDTNRQITHFVSSMGTTGTIMGTSSFLKGVRPEIQIIGVQPTDGSRIPGIRRWPKEYLPKIFDPTKVDKIIDVSEADAKAMANRLAKEEGIFSGMSSGGAMVAALQIADSIDSGTIVSIVCDRGDRYLSSDLFGV